METFDGDYYTSDDIALNKITIVNAWGPYCTYCLAEMPDLEELYQEYKERF